MQWPLATGGYGDLESGKCDRGNPVTFNWLELLIEVVAVFLGIDGWFCGSFDGVTVRKKHGCFASICPSSIQTNHEVKSRRHTISSSYHGDLRCQVVQFTATGPGASRSLQLQEVYPGINFHHKT